MGVDTAVVIPAREKLSRVTDALDAVLAHTEGEFRVYVVDVGYPSELLMEIERRATDGAPVVLVPGGQAQVLANAALNRALEASDEPFVCVVENDVVVEPGYWRPLRALLAAGSYDLVSPTIWDGRSGKIHFDPPVSEIQPTVDGGYRSELVRRPKQAHPRVEGVRRIHHLEKHAFAGTRDAMQRLYPFDEAVWTRTDIDLSLSAAHMRLRLGMCPDAEVTFWGPPVTEVDHPFFSHRWDLDRAVTANEHLIGKWRLQAEGDYLDFVHEMRAFI